MFFIYFSISLYFHNYLINLTGIFILRGIFMESVKNTKDIEKLEDNKVIGNPELVNSVIHFSGKNNILYCENDVKLNTAKIHFKGSNSIIYLSSSKKSQYPLNVFIYNNSTLFIGRNNRISANLTIYVQEKHNVIIGNDGIIEKGVNIKTSDSYPIYDVDSKQRVNFSGSVFIGDHVWLSHLSYISRGVKIGSGAIIGNYAYVPPNFLVFSNSYLIGNPANIIQEDVFFTKDYLGPYKTEDSVNSSTYRSDVFIYDFVEKETLSMDELDEILESLNIEQRLEFIKKLFANNVRKNRFSIR